MRSETSGELTVRSNLVGNAGSRPISEAKQPWACPVLGWGTTGEAHVLYSFYKFSGDPHSEVRTVQHFRHSFLPTIQSPLKALCLAPVRLLTPRRMFSFNVWAGSGLPFPWWFDSTTALRSCPSILISSSHFCLSGYLVPDRDV